jgi:putative dimethyl sulfoxide reductase chaperone
MLSSNQGSLINLGPAELALARHLTYELLGRLYLEGVTAVTLSTIQIIPSLSQTIPEPFNADEAAASHQTLFGFNVFPYESIFLDSSGLLGGAITDAVLFSYQEAGFAVAADSTSPDHVGHELALLAHLCGAEADAWMDNRPLVAERMQNLQRRFLQEHLLHWLIPFVTAIKGQKRPFYTALANLTRDFIHDHFQELAAHAAPLRLPVYLPAPPALLNNEKTGLKEIAHYLTTPPYSGFFLSWQDVTQLARTQNIPRGFGDRTQMLTNLLRGAAQFDTLTGLFDELRVLTNSWQEAYATSAESMPVLAPFIATWQERMTQTSQTLTQIEQQIKLDA